MKAILAATAVVVAGVAPAADEWPWPPPQVFSAVSGSYALRTTPAAAAKTVPGPSPFGRSQAALFKPGPDGKDAVLWKRELVNAPYRALVTDDGKYVVTLDTWGRVGYAHSVVIYGEHGKLIADHDLEALIPRDEITERVQHSTSSRWWLRDATTTFTETSGELMIALKWGKTLRVDLATGRVSTSRSTHAN